MKPRSKPRYKAPEKAPRGPRRGKDRPLDLTPKHPARGWFLSISGLVLSTVIPYALLWGCDMRENPYHVRFDARPTDVRLDGKPVTLELGAQFEFPRLPPGDHRLVYRDADGKEQEIVLHARLDDDRSRRLQIHADRTEGAPEAEFVR